MESIILKLKGYKPEIQCHVLQENEDWILARQVVNDNLNEGLLLIKKRYIRKRLQSSNQENRNDNTIYSDQSFLENFTFDSTKNVLENLDQSQGFVRFQDGGGSLITTGLLFKSRKKKFRIDLIKENFSLMENYDYDFKYKKVRLIFINSKQCLETKKGIKKSFCVLPK